MTKHLFATLTVLLAIGGLWTGGSHAQVDSIQTVSRDSLPEASQQPNVVVRRGQTTSVSTGVQRVRQRIARIGRGRVSAQRVIYPLIILPPSPQVIYVREGRAEGGRSVSGAAVPGPVPRLDRRSDVSSNQNYDDERYLDEDRPPVVRFRQRTGETPDSLAPPEEPPPPIVRRVERAMLETGLFRAVGVNFEFDEAEILPTFRPTLDAVGEVLRRYPALRIQIAGHTDAIGSESYNQGLSMRRAQAVRQYLIQRFGIEASRLTAQGYGETQPIAPNDTRTGRTLNRRVEFRVLNPEAAERIIESPDTTQSVEEMIRRAIQEELQRRTGPDTSGQR